MGAILNCKAMLLASHGENFGISIVESLSMGRPVITTNKVNIYSDILKSKSGFISDNTTIALVKNFCKFESLDKTELKKCHKILLDVLKKF